MGTSNTDASDKIPNSVNDGSAHDLPIGAILKGMNQDEINRYILSNFTRLNTQYEELSEQFREIASVIKSGNKNVTDRIEHILTLMTSNMMFVKQMIQLENSSLTRLDDQEKVDAKLELQFSTIINRQNQFAQCIENMNNNSKAILTEIEQLRANDINNDKFKTKVTLIASLCTVVVYWLISSLNLSNVAALISELSKLGGK